MISILIFITGTCLGCFGIFKLLMWHFQRRHLYELASKLDGPPTLPFVGNAHSFIGDSEHILKKLAELEESYDSLCPVWLGPNLLIGIINADHIQRICNHPTTMDKGYQFRRFAGPLFGTGLLTAPVSKWRMHRKIIQPTFNKKILDSNVGIFSTQAKIFTEQMERNLDGPEFEIFKSLCLLTLDTVCESIMGVKIGAQTNPNSRYVEALEHITYSTIKRIFTFWLHPGFIYNRSKLGKTANENVKYLHHYTERVIDMKRNDLLRCNSCQPAEADDEGGEFVSVPQRKSCIDHLLKLTDDDGKLSKEDLREEVTTLMLSGNDTTAMTLMYTMLMLASNPDVQEKVYQELYEIYGDTDIDEHPVMPEDLRRMKYLERVFKETLRLFPAIPYIIRELTEDLDIGGKTLPKGSYAAIGIHRVQRNEKYWPNPLQFDPDRFLPEEYAKRHPCAFMAFSTGPRNCIGFEHSMISLKTVMATILRRYILKKDHIVPVKDIRLALEVVLKPVEPVTLRIERRIKN